MHRAERARPRLLQGKGFKWAGDRVEWKSGAGRYEAAGGRQRHREREREREREGERERDGQTDRQRQEQEHVRTCIHTDTHKPHTQRHKHTI